VLRSCLVSCISCAAAFQSVIVFSIPGWTFVQEYDDCDQVDSQYNCWWMSGRSSRRAAPQLYAFLSCNMIRVIKSTWSTTVNDCQDAPCVGPCRLCVCSSLVIWWGWSSWLGVPWYKCWWLSGWSLLAQDRAAASVCCSLRSTHRRSHDTNRKTPHRQVETRATVFSSSSSGFCLRSAFYWNNQQLSKQPRCLLHGTSPITAQHVALMTLRLFDIQPGPHLLMLFVPSARNPSGRSRAFLNRLCEDMFRHWHCGSAHEKSAGRHADASDEANTDQWRCVCQKLNRRVDLT